MLYNTLILVYYQHITWICAVCTHIKRYGGITRLLFELPCSFFCAVTSLYSIYKIQERDDCQAVKSIGIRNYRWKKELFNLYLYLPLSFTLRMLLVDHNSVPQSHQNRLPVIVVNHRTIVVLLVMMMTSHDSFPYW